MKTMRRIVPGLFFALLFALSAFALAPSETAVAQEGGGDPDCQSCHRAIHEVWLDSDHGHSVTDPAFQEAWKEQGEPKECLSCHTTGYNAAMDIWQAEGITCAACHSPVPDNHPTAPMPSDRSAELCGSCHTETMFEWQVSAHRETNLACVGCHGQHSTGLKTEDPSELCATCHRDRSSNFAHTAHSQEGLTCADCHLGPTNGEVVGEGHAVRDHSFNVKLSTCNECHAYQMHDPVEVHTDRPGPNPEDQPEVASEEALQSMGVSPNPDPVSPYGFASLAGLLGLAVGVIAAPWLERGVRSLRSKDQDE